MTIINILIRVNGSDDLTTIFLHFVMNEIVSSKNILEGYLKSPLAWKYLDSWSCTIWPHKFLPGLHGRFLLTALATHAPWYTFILDHCASLVSSFPTSATASQSQPKAATVVPPICLHCSFLFMLLDAIPFLAVSGHYMCTNCFWPSMNHKPLWVSHPATLSTFNSSPSNLAGLFSNSG